MRRRAALLLLLLLPAPPVAAQPAPEPEPALDEPSLPDPAAAPPAPPVLDPGPAPSTTAPSQPAAPPPLPPDVEALPEGGIRLHGAAFSAAARQALVDYGRRLAATPRGRVTVIAEVAGPVTDPHTARRNSLARAQAAKTALLEGGLPGTRIDLRPMGRTEAGTDRLDVLPPGVTRSDQAR
ncbi:MAG TPA: hypothetical protein VGM87_23805 [Roseomonas sp.]|jgi:hypothetical protein